MIYLSRKQDFAKLFFNNLSYNNSIGQNYGVNNVSRKINHLIYKFRKQINFIIQIIRETWILKASTNMQNYLNYNTKQKHTNHKTISF